MVQLLQKQAGFFELFLRLKTLLGAKLLGTAEATCNCSHYKKCENNRMYHLKVKLLHLLKITLKQLDLVCLLAFTVSEVTEDWY